MKSSSLLFLCLVSFVYSIHISTGSLEEIYSGPNGYVAEPWDFKTGSPLFNEYYSVVDILFGRSVVEDYYSLPLEEKFEPPVLTVLSGEDIIEPEVYGAATEGYSFEEENFYWEELPELTIYFNCKANGEATLSLQVESSVNVGAEQWETEVIEFFFRKKCYSPGYRDGFSIGFGDNIDNVVRHGVVQHRWSVESDYLLDTNPQVVPSTDHLATFFISISSEQYGNQRFGEPQIELEDDEMIDIQIRGNAGKGGVASGMVESLVLFFDCKEEGNTQVTIKIPLEFFGIIEFAFSKVCEYKDLEGAMPGIINIGTTRSDYSAIVKNSITSSDWTSEKLNVDVPVDQIISSFYVSTESGMTQEILAPVVTIDPPTAFKATLSGNLRSGGVVSGSPQHFIVNYICDHVSQGTVTISVKMPHADTVEFSYIKHCKTLRRHNERVWTANQMLIVFILCVFAVVVAVYSLLKKQKQSKK